MYFAQRSLMYFPDTVYVTPAAVGLPQAEEVTLTTADGVKVTAWHVAPSDGKPVILYFHGNGGALKYRVERFGKLISDGIGLVALSMVVMLRVTHDADPLAREDLAFALSVILLGLLMMVTRRNAVSQVVGFMSLENGLVLAATGAKGMPLVVEISVAFSVLIAFIVIGIFLFRIRERFDTVDVQALDRFRGERR